VLRSQGLLVNHKRARACWGDEGPSGNGSGPGAVTGSVRASRRFCNIVDGFTPEALATGARRSFTANDTTIGAALEAVSTEGDVCTRAGSWV